jgi:hypothetical protein
MDPCGSLGLGWLNGIFLAEYMTTITELYLSPNGDAYNWLMVDAFAWSLPLINK